MWEDGEKSTTDVLDNGDPPPETEKPSGEGEEGKGADKGKPKSGDEDLTKAELAQLRKDNEALNKRLTELSESERYWASLAQGGDDREPEPEPEPEREIITDDDPEKFQEALQAEGIRALEKRGVLTRAEANELLKKHSEKSEARMREIATEIVSGARKQMTNDAELLREFPELGDEKSEFYQRTKAEFRAMVAEDENLRNSPVALKMAARVASRELEGETRKGDREDRIRRQAAKGRSRTAQDTEPDELTRTQSTILQKFNRDGGVTISEEAYKKRAKAGVNMAARPTYNPGEMNWEQD